LVARDTPAETAETAETAEVAALHAEVAARDKTIEVLMDRVEGRFDAEGSAFALLQQNIAMEQIVATRTSELAETNRKLAAALTDLERTQQEMAVAQRLAALGTLAGGVAHEINTPVQFMADSVHFLLEGTRDLFALLDPLLELRRGLTAGVAAETLAGVAVVAAEREAAVEADFLRAQMPNALDACLIGLQRVAAIVRSLQELAHPEPSEMLPSDLNRTIENVLVITANEYGDTADMKRDLGPLPPVCCRIDEIDQVVLNLVLNATHAIRETGRRGTITVTTRVDGDDALIEIADTGVGVPPAIRHRIFEPFFTTRDVGQGSGQGLSLVWAIVTEKHRGKVSFETEVGRGTTFSVRLPIANAPRGRGPTAG
jgi:signal transduction histidine kinase